MTTAHATRCTGDKLQLRSDDHTYNGWSNYPTWAASLWIGEEPFWMAQVAQIVLAEREKKSEYNLEQVHAADRIKEMIEDSLDEVGEDAKPPTTGLAADLYNYAFGEIDWLEIARHWWDEEGLENYAEDY